MPAFPPDIGEGPGSIHELAAVGFTGAESDLLAQLCEPEAFQRFLSPLRSFATFAVKTFDFQFPLFGNLGDLGNPVLLRVSAPPR